jgi:hypothetical protein
VFVGWDFTGEPLAGLLERLSEELVHLRDQIVGARRILLRLLHPRWFVVVGEVR